MGKYKCEECKDTGWVGDNGAGIRGNNEYEPCFCITESDEATAKSGRTVVSQTSEPSFGQWILIEDETKPNKGQRVLVIQNPETTATREPLFAIYDGENFIPPRPQIFADFTYGNSKWTDIIKWMPLPKL